MVAIHPQSSHIQEKLSLDVSLQVGMQKLDVGGTEDAGCDAPNMLTGTIPPSWGSMTQLTQ
jgi:hypothetical protein